MGKKVIREKRSKLQGKEATLQALNQSAHRELHEAAGPTNVAGGVYISTAKWKM